MAIYLQSAHEDGEEEPFATRPCLGHVLVFCTTASPLGRAMTATTPKTNLLWPARYSPPKRAHPPPSHRLWQKIIWSQWNWESVRVCVVGVLVVVKTRLGLELWGVGVGVEWHYPSVQAINVCVCELGESRSLHWTKWVGVGGIFCQFPFPKLFPSVFSILEL